MVRKDPGHRLRTFFVCMSKSTSRRNLFAKRGFKLLGLTIKLLTSPNLFGLTDYGPQTTDQKNDSTRFERQARAGDWSWRQRELCLVHRQGPQRRGGETGVFLSSPIQALLREHYRTRRPLRMSSRAF